MVHMERPAERGGMARFMVESPAGRSGMARSMVESPAGRSGMARPMVESPAGRGGMARPMVESPAGACGEPPWQKGVEVHIGYLQEQGDVTYRYFMTKMSEGRKSQVILLDDRRLDLLIQPKLYAGELLDIVASHFQLREKEYFGLSFKDDSGHHHWLQLDRKVLEHEFPKKAGTINLYFSVRFFIETIAYLREKSTIELFYLQAKQSVFKGLIEADSESAFELAAHVLQATYGDHTDDATAKKQLKKLPVLPVSVLKEHPSIAFCEENVLGHYRKLEGQTRGAAIVNYMTIVESLPTYGIHYYEVKDKGHIPWWLGLSYKGISLYDYADKRVPRRVFAWKQLENLYFRDKKFSIEVHEAKRVVHTLSSFNLYEDAIQEPIDEFDDLSDAISDPTTQVSVSRRTFGPGNVNVHAWFAGSPLLTKCIWSMAVSQHQFYLDRKQSKSQLPQVRSMSEIAADLSQSSTSLHSSVTSEGISRSNSSHSLTLSTYNSKVDLTAEELEASRAAHRDMYAALKARKEALEDALRKKTEELKAICIKEGEVTGELPVETPLAPGEPIPQIRRRMGTSFALSPKLFNRDKASETEEILARLELDMEIQDKISNAAYRLAHDKSVAKSVRKQRKQQYHKAHLRLRDIAKKLNEYRERLGRIPVEAQSSVEEPEFASPMGSPSLQRHAREVGSSGYSNGRSHSLYQTPSSTPQMKIFTSPQAEIVEVEPPAPAPLSQTGPTLTYSKSFTPADSGSSRPLTHQGRHPYPQHRQGQHPPHPMAGQHPVATPQHKSAPASPVRQPHGAPRVSTPSPNPSRHPVGGYVPSSVYSTQYRRQMYTTWTSRSPPNAANGNGNFSDYENSSYPPPPPSAGVVERVGGGGGEGGGGGGPRQTPEPGHVHNLYNVNSTRTTRYDSTDELKSGPEDYDSYSSDQGEMGGYGGPAGGSAPGPGPGPGPPRPSTLGRRPSADSADYGSVGSGGGGGVPRSYGSLERNSHLRGEPHAHPGYIHAQHPQYPHPHHPNAAQAIPLAELSPSKFGSKRESHSDYRDSPYQIIDMPPPPRRTDHYQEYGGGGGGHRQPDDAPHNASIPYMDSSQSSVASSISSSSNNPPPPSWYDPGGGGTLRQQAPPHTPQYESPHPAYLRQDVPPIPGPGGYDPDPGGAGYPPSPSSGGGGDTPHQKPATVTKYQGFVEVSKPFEMSDFYKYSERLRKQRQPGSPTQSPHRHPSPHSPYVSTRTPHPLTQQGQDPQQGSRSRPASPYTQHRLTPTPEAGGVMAYPAQHSSPYPGATAPYQPPQGVHSNFVQYHNASSAPYQQQSPKHVAYQPPAPMSFEPLPPQQPATPHSPGHNRLV